jgi:NADH-quinone oxidoreductase subunit A
LCSSVSGLPRRGLRVINSGSARKPKRRAKTALRERHARPTVTQGFRFGISFYLIAMLFILFDIEVLFLYPVAIQLKAFGWFALIELTIFVVLLFVAFIYVWRRGALEWK